MNNPGVFKGLFQMSLMEESRIKTANYRSHCDIWWSSMRMKNGRVSSRIGPMRRSGAKLATDQSEALLDEYVFRCAATISQ